jgi:hypothetical protein
MSESIITFSEDITNAPPPPLLPPGPYPCEIIGAIKRTSRAGHQYAAITFRINPQVYPADFIDGDPDGTDIQYNFLRIGDTPADRHRWRRFMEKVGGPLGREIDLNALLGLTCTIEITHQQPDDYNEEVRLNVARVLAP